MYREAPCEIRPSLRPWLDSLIFAARTCDPLFDAATEKNWREAMQPGIDYVVSFYQIHLSEPIALFFTSFPLHSIS